MIYAVYALVITFCIYTAMAVCALAFTLPYKLLVRVFPSQRYYSYERTLSHLPHIIDRARIFLFRLCFASFALGILTTVLLPTLYASVTAEHVTGRIVDVVQVGRDCDTRPTCIQMDKQPGITVAWMDRGIHHQQTIDGYFGRGHAHKVNYFRGFSKGDSVALLVSRDDPTKVFKPVGLVPFGAFLLWCAIAGYLCLKVDLFYRYGHR